MVFANINNRLNALEEKLNNLASASSSVEGSANVPVVNTEAYDAKLADLEAKLAGVQAVVDKVAVIEQNVQNVENANGQFNQQLTALLEQMNILSARVNELADVMQNA